MQLGGRSIENRIQKGQARGSSGDWSWMLFFLTGIRCEFSHQLWFYIFLEVENTSTTQFFSLLRKHIDMYCVHLACMKWCILVKFIVFCKFMEYELPAGQVHCTLLDWYILSHQKPSLYHEEKAFNEKWSTYWHQIIRPISLQLYHTLFVLLRISIHSNNSRSTP